MVLFATASNKTRTSVLRRRSPLPAAAPHSWPPAPWRSEHIALADELARGIERGQIEAWIQPQVDLSTGHIVGVEALARWRHPERGLLLPSHFLALLPLTDSYNAFTDEILRQALAFAAQAEQVGAPLDVAVNCGAASYVDCRIVDSVQALLQASGVRPERLKLELVESEPLDDQADHQPVFAALEALGTRLSIDDFGMGYSSLRRLSRLPVHELKIDSSFVAAMFSNRSMLAIVRSIIDLAQALNLTSVAEGIESASTASLLRQMGCSLGQGYLFQAPLPADSFLQRFTVVDGFWQPLERSAPG